MSDLGGVWKKWKHCLSLFCSTLNGSVWKRVNDQTICLTGTYAHHVAIPIKLSAFCFPVVKRIHLSRQIFSQTTVATFVYCSSYKLQLLAGAWTLTGLTKVCSCALKWQDLFQKARKSLVLVMIGLTFSADSVFQQVCSFMLRFWFENIFN